MIRILRVVETGAGSVSVSVTGFRVGSVELWSCRSVFNKSVCQSPH
jgi:hypothetical protein